MYKFYKWFQISSSKTVQAKQFKQSIKQLHVLSTETDQLLTDSWTIFNSSTSEVVKLSQYIDWSNRWLVSLGTNLYMLYFVGNKIRYLSDCPSTM